MSAEPREPELMVTEGETVDLDALLEPQPLQHPPAVRPTCPCGNGSLEAHGYVPGKRRPFTCAEVLAIRARAAYGGLPWWRRLLTPRPEGWPR